ncbi:hypothetical protein BN1723_015399 [Verticillium longisporum]|uniref:Uncharacterized protein n=1 Tax=Verticillium longisporum TaxID=100787 RepID=A0A0G4MXF7_VERLO|nr:hypothetical protein HYQ44_007122 [Verticillium longisporum]CRK17615.1 hypothetical protein BN1708_012114 [Verticillium longisporum]CRK38799.1 hypothetical protein BN1723_015399 [Verticillium longisporum]
MATRRTFFSFLAALCAAQGINATSYCYCEGGPGFHYLGIETVCAELGTSWNTTNCDLGSSDVCKFGGDGGAPTDGTQSLRQWCESPDRQGRDLSGETVQGGALICTESKPESIDDSCEALGQAGLEEDIEGPPIDLDEPVDGSEDTDGIPTRLRRQADKFGSDFLRYVPASKTANLIKTASNRNVKTHGDGSKETIYQVNELRLKGYNWKFLRSYDNQKGAADFTDSVEITKGFETSSGSNTKAELAVSFGYNGLAAQFSVDASLSHEFFSQKRETVTTKRNETFFVPKGAAAYLYQKVYVWESTVTFRLTSVGGPFDNGGKPGKRGTFDLAIDESEPLLASFEFDVLTEEKVVKDAPLLDRGTLDVARLFELKEPKFPKAEALYEEDWTGHVRDFIKKLGFSI